MEGERLTDYGVSEGDLKRALVELLEHLQFWRDESGPLNVTTYDLTHLRRGNERDIDEFVRDSLAV